jgi:hypothetical protein
MRELLARRLCGRRLGFISQGHGTYQQPPAAPPEAIRKENAETLLRKIIERNDPRYSAAAYILAAMLERKRLLKVKEQFKRDGQRVFVYEQPKTADIFTITDPALQLNQLEEIQRQVGDLLEHGLPSDVTVSEPAHETNPPAAAAEAQPAEAAEANVDAGSAETPPGDEEKNSTPKSAPAEAPVAG